MVLGEFPTWLVHGIILGLVFSLGVFLVYMAGQRWWELGRPAAGRYDPDGLRRAEVRAYLVAIGEDAVESFRIDGIETDFWLPQRQVAITFDASVYFRLRDAGVTVVLLEHEVPGHRIGPRLPFETPPLQSTTAETNGTDWAHSVLGVEIGADDAAIEQAYRDRIKEVHPDVGGDQAALIEVLEAYEQLSTAS